MQETSLLPQYFWNKYNFPEELYLPILNPNGWCVAFQPEDIPFSDNSLKATKPGTLLLEPDLTISLSTTTLQYQSAPDQEWAVQTHTLLHH